jgi:primary-amine oxidase
MQAYTCHVGSFIRPNVQGVIHDHIINYKLDFDIVGVENSFRTQTLRDKEFAVDWSDDPAHTQSATYLDSHYVATEDESRLNWPVNGETLFTVGASRPPKQFDKFSADVQK